jgi:hypothetical protein
MFSSKIIANDHSKNGSSAAQSQVREKEGSDLIKAFGEIAGERSHFDMYTLDLLANFFRKNYDFAKFINPKNEDERGQVNRLFGRVTGCLDFNVYLQRKVATHLKGKFTSEELRCIFQAYNDIWVQYNSISDTHVKEALIDFIDSEGILMHKLDDVDSFKNKINSMNPFEFEIFVNLIIDIRRVGNKMIENLHDFLRN